jgi:DNA-binding NarL/FixJ family response regulator
MLASILVVDDDVSVRGLIVRILRSWNHEVIGEAGSIAEALEYAAARRPGIALVDIGLPDGDGFFLTRQLRLQPWAIRVVLFSSDADPSNTAAAARAGAIGFFPKDELLSPALQRLIEDRTDDEQ